MNDPRGIRVLEGMTTDVLGRPQPMRIENGESSRMGLQGVELHCGLHQQSSRNWRTNGGDESTSADGSDGDEDPDEDDDAEDDDIREGDDEVDGLVSIRGSNAKHNTNSSDSVQSSSEKFHSEKANLRDHPSFGTRREALVKDLNHIRGTPSEQLHHQEPIGNYDNAITVVEPEQFCSQVLHGGDGPTLARKQFKQQGGENGFSLCGSKEMNLSMDPAESLRGHLSDPITGVLMDDAMILSCGHSFGSSGMQHIYRMKACYKCLQLVSEDSIRPNLSLRYAVQAFLREEESQYLRPPKRRRERLEQEKCMYDESISMDSRGKGVLFPFVISDRVIIKGNKRTPQRFVGRVAVVTTQCLNGWYVVKTLDNAESVKLQYRSLAKVTDVAPSITIAANKPVCPSWL